MFTVRASFLTVCIGFATLAGCSRDHHDSTGASKAPLKVREGGPLPDKQVMKAIEPGIVTAAREGDLAVLKSEISSGADINTRGSRGITPIMAAAQMGHKALVQYLLDQKADANMRDAEGRTARQLAHDAHHDDIADLLSKNIVKPPVGPAKPVTEPKPLPTPEKPVQ